MNREISMVDYTAKIGERIAEWIETLTHENGCKRDWEEMDSFDKEDVSWVFTEKGQRLYESYLHKGYMLINEKFPFEVADDLEQHTGVMTP